MEPIVECSPLSVTRAPICWTVYASPVHGGNGGQEHGEGEPRDRVGRFQTVLDEGLIYDEWWKVMPDAGREHFRKAMLSEAEGIAL